MRHEVRLFLGITGSNRSSRAGGRRPLSLCPPLPSIAGWWKSFPWAMSNRVLLCETLASAHGDLEGKRGGLVADSLPQRGRLWAHPPVSVCPKCLLSP